MLQQDAAFALLQKFPNACQQTRIQMRRLGAKAVAGSPRCEMHETLQVTLSSVDAVGFCSAMSGAKGAGYNQDKVLKFQHLSLESRPVH